MTKKVTERGTLFYGVERSGVVHCDFELRLPTVGDNIDAVEEVGSHNALAVSGAVLARQLVMLGELPVSEISYAVISSLHPTDYNILEEAAQRLEKKSRAARTAELASSEPASPSSAAA